MYSYNIPNNSGSRLPEKFEDILTIGQVLAYLEYNREKSMCYI